MDGTRPSDGEGHVQTIEPRTAEMPPVNAKKADGLAEALRRKGVELAWATIDAIAISEFHSVEFPFDHPCLLATYRRHSIVN
jgi:hypothetical protein